jgi:RHS repeat-associated protein
VIADYAHGETPIAGIGSMVAARKTESAQTYYQYPVYDHRGSVVKIVDAGGAVKDEYEYDAWGVRLQAQESGASNRFGYQSNWITLNDSGGGLLLSPTRLYDASLGRFLQRDPIGFKGGINLYRAYFVPNGADALGLETTGCEYWIEQWWVACGEYKEAYEELISLHDKLQNVSSEINRLHAAWADTQSRAAYTREAGMFPTSTLTTAAGGAGAGAAAKAIGISNFWTAITAFVFVAVYEGLNRVQQHVEWHLLHNDVYPKLIKNKMRKLPALLTAIDVQNYKAAKWIKAMKEWEEMINHRNSGCCEYKYHRRDCPPTKR